jgi:hypothetical protein
LHVAADYSFQTCVSILLMKRGPLTHLVPVSFFDVSIVLQLALASASHLDLTSDRVSLLAFCTLCFVPLWRCIFQILICLIV